MDKVFVVEVHNWDSHGGWEYVTTAHPSFEAAERAVRERLGFVEVEVDGKRYFVDPDYVKTRELTKKSDMWTVRRAVVRSVPFFE